MNNKKKSKPVRLVHVTTSLKIGGAETMLVDLVGQLKKKGFEQQVIYFYDGPHVDRMRKLGIPAYQVQGMVCMYDPLFFLRLFKLLKKLKPDCLHTVLWAGNFAGRIVASILKIPVVAALHNNIDQNGRFRIILDRFTLSGVDKLVAVSEQVKQSLLQFIPSSRLPQIKVIPNGIDTDMICRQGARSPKDRKELGFSEKHFVIGSVGRFVKIKNYHLLIEQLPSLVAQYSHVRLLLIGIGPEEKNIRQKIKTNGLDNFVKIVVNQPALAYYSLLDCFVLPSYKEGISMALLEAMSFGLPCVVGNYIEDHMVIKSGLNGRVVTPDQSFADALRELIEQEQMRKIYAHEAHLTVKQQFGFQKMVNSYESVFKEVVK